MGEVVAPLLAAIRELNARIAAMDHVVEEVGAGHDAVASLQAIIDEAFGRGSDESAQYGLRLFAQLNLQLLIVTPLQKIHVIEHFVSAVGFVHNSDGQASSLRNLTIEEYRKEKEAERP